MKSICLILVSSCAILTGCSSSSDAPAAASVDANLTPQEKITKIQNDPKIPDGLKKIQIESLQRQPGNK